MNAQQPDWLVNWPVCYTLNPGLPRHVLASCGNGGLMSARLVSSAIVFGLDVFGPCAVERLDPGTGQPLWTCSLSDSLTVESGAVDTSGNVYVAGRFLAPIDLCDGSVIGHTGGGLDVDLYLMKFDPTGAPDSEILTDIKYDKNCVIDQPKDFAIKYISNEKWEKHLNAVKNSFLDQRIKK